MTNLSVSIWICFQKIDINYLIHALLLNSIILCLVFQILMEGYQYIMLSSTEKIWYVVLKKINCLFDLLTYYVIIHLLCLTHWGRVTHICISKLTIIVSDNGLSPGLRHAIIWTNAGILLIRPLETNFSEILIEIHTFSFKKIHLKMSSGKCHPFWLGLNELNKLLYQQWKKMPLRKHEELTDTQDKINQSNISM